MYGKLVRCAGWSFVAAWSLAGTASIPIAIAWCAWRSVPFMWGAVWEVSCIGTVALGVILTIWFLDHVGDAWRRTRDAGRSDDLERAIAAFRHLTWHTCIPLLCWTYGSRACAFAARRILKLTPFHHARSSEE